MSLDDMFKPMPKQLELIDALNVYSMIFYGGGRGGAKTSGSVYAAVLASLQFPGLRTAVFRKHLNELRDQIIMNELLAKYPQTFYTYHSSIKTAFFHNGSTIVFRALEHEQDVEKEQGVERGLYILDEGNKLPWRTIMKLRGSLRQPSLPHWKPTMIITGNPGGVCDRDIKVRWIKPDYSRWPAEELKTKHEYKWIESHVWDNVHLGEDYISHLKSQPEDVRRAWYDGDWEVFSGQFFTEWREGVHVIEGFDIPGHWPRWRSIDLGYQDHPSVCLFLAQDPDPYLEDGSPNEAYGRLYVYDEVATKSVTEVFLDMILRASGDDDFRATYFDPRSMSGRKDTYAQNSPAMMFMQEGILCTRAFTDREVGWLNLKQWLHWHGREENGELIVERQPSVQVFRQCLGLIETMPILQYKDHKPDLDSKAQDDYADAFRYGTSHIQFGQVYTDRGYESKVSVVDRIPQAIRERYIPTDDMDSERYVNATHVSPYRNGVTLPHRQSGRRGSRYTRF